MKTNIEKKDSCIIILAVGSLVGRAIKRSVYIYIYIIIMIMIEIKIERYSVRVSEDTYRL